jgi:hypothetical protein
MGRPRKVTVSLEPETEPIIEQSPAEAATAAAEEEKELQDQIQAGEWLSDFQNRFTDQPVKILVEKFDETGEWSICRKYPLANFDPDGVRIEFGGGKYRCTLYDPNGKWVKGGRTYFKFADPIIKPNLNPKQENPLDNPVVAMMLSTQKQNADTLMGVLQSLIAAQSAGGAGRPGSLGEIVEVVKSINSMTPKDKPMESFKETLGLFKLVKEVTGDDDGDSKGGLLSGLKEVLEILPQLKEQMATIKPPAPAPEQPQLTKGEPTEMDPLTKKIIDLVPKFIGGARANAPIPEWGNYLLDVFDTEVVPLLIPVMKQKYPAFVKTEDDVYEVVIKLAKDPTERAEGLKQIPPLTPYLPWVNQVIDEAIRLAETETPEAPAGGSAILTEVLTNGKD